MRDTWPEQRPEYRYALVQPGSAPEALVVLIPAPTAGHGSFLAGLGFTGCLLPNSQNGAGWKITLARSEAQDLLRELLRVGYRLRPQSLVLAALCQDAERHESVPKSG